ncbi:histidine phosphatase family protein [Phenylobacterium montanum]|uniref:Histidine phosphatase family protein n=1 Tax=Phenylobacterium montanum TaxID=2823693 RepID=A0A975G095_9CAUL|nr:histidine phosphatase family protein [Caulobacter sp. S6]QUD88177.1 histidine phosphatase family protein [Caulobacter sp. S6]
MSRLYMIRHGKPSSTWGDEAAADPGLDEAGRAQAEAAADALMALPEGERPTRVLSSPLRRCRETAQPFADRLGVAVEIDPRFGEIPTPAALTEAERGPWLRQVFTGRWTEAKGDLDYDAWRRGIASALADFGGWAVFSHFVAINAAVTTLMGKEEVLAFRPDHCAITVFEVGAEGLRLVELGPEAQTQVL